MTKPVNDAIARLQADIARAAERGPETGREEGPKLATLRTPVAPGPLLWSSWTYWRDGVAVIDEKPPHWIGRAFVTRMVLRDAQSWNVRDVRVDRVGQLAGPVSGGQFAEGLAPSWQIEVQGGRTEIRVEVTAAVDVVLDEHGAPSNLPGPTWIDWYGWPVDNAGDVAYPAPYALIDDGGTQIVSPGCASAVQTFWRSRPFWLQRLRLESVDGFKGVFVQAVYVGVDPVLGGKPLDEIPAAAEMLTLPMVVSNGHGMTVIVANKRDTPFRFKARFEGRFTE